MKNPITLFVNISALGDVIGAEPALRYAVTHTFKDISKDILVATVYPELFTHLPLLNPDVTIMHTDKVNDEIHLHLDRKVFRTNPDPVYPENNVHNFAQTAMHTVDFVSLHLLKAILPEEHKHINLPLPTTNEIISITNKFKTLGLDLENTLLVHSGVTWPSRTVPYNWWKVFLKECKKNSIPVCLIGKTSKTQNLDALDSNFRPGVFKFNDYPSLINKLSLRELIVAIAQSWGLITNDSSPFHIAAAFNRYLFTFATSREWFKLKPYHHDKAYNLVKRFPFDNTYWCPLLPRKRVDKLPTGVESLYDCIHDPDTSVLYIKTFRKNDLK